MQNQFKTFSSRKLLKSLIWQTRTPCRQRQTTAQLTLGFLNAVIVQINRNNYVNNLHKIHEYLCRKSRHLSQKYRMATKSDL